LAVVDEAAFFDPDKVQENLEPTQIGRRMPQLWYFGMPHQNGTQLVPSKVRQALDPSNDVMVALWGAAPDADFDDWEVWKAAWPHIDKQKEKDLRRAFDLRPEGWMRQYLGVWPDLAAEKAEQWPPAWGLAERVPDEVPEGGVAALESTVTRSHYGCAYSVRVGEETLLWTARFSTQAEAVAWLHEHKPARVLVGLSLKKELPDPLYVGVGMAETLLSTPVLQDLVARSQLRHDHNPVMTDQTANARLSETDRGLTLSGKRSIGAIETLKASCWATYFANQPQPERPVIWV
jgi:hypothetical protein